jgi:HSP20 family molecular chaperone IbpA
MRGACANVFPKIDFATINAMCKVNSSLYYVHKPAGGRRESAGETHWIPNTDVYLTEGNLVIKVELAGLHRDDLELAMEINYGHFECVIDRIPEGYELSQSKAAYQNGFLEITVPQVKQPASKNHLVPIAEG